MAHHAQVRDAIYAAIRLPLVERHIRHEKHWKYVSNHTVQFWAKVSSRGHGAPEGESWGCGRGGWVRLAVRVAHLHRLAQLPRILLHMC